MGQFDFKQSINSMIKFIRCVCVCLCVCVRARACVRMCVRVCSVRAATTTT